MKVSVIGCGYLGAVHACAMAELGHHVVGIDVDQARVDRLSAGEPPFFEPGLQELLRTATASGRLRFSSRYPDARGANVHFLAVGTPQRADGAAADLRFVEAAVDSLLPQLQAGDLVAGKSTVPVGTAARLADRVEAAGGRLAWNPEFLREGHAVQDTLRPDRLVYGVRDPDRRDGGEHPDARLLSQVYRAAVEAGTPQIVTDYATAELVKVAANAFLATKISFINAMAEIAEVTGADVTQLADAIGHDPRIGRQFLDAGVGFGGGCLPKDIRAFTARAQELGRGESVDFLRQVDQINLRRRARVVELVRTCLGGSVVGRRVAVLGLAFKPASDDVRDSPALDVAMQLHGRGADVIACDPQAVPTARALHPHLQYAADAEECLRGADAVVLVTEWPEYRELDPKRAAELARGRVMIDGRNCLDAAAWRSAGWDYRGLGRR